MTRSSRRRDILRTNECFLTLRITFLNSEIHKAREKAKLYYRYARPRQPQEKGFWESLWQGQTLDPRKGQMGPLFEQAIDRAKAKQYEEKAQKLEKELYETKARLVEIRDDIRQEQQQRQQSSSIQNMPYWLREHIRKYGHSPDSFGNQSISHQSAWPVDIDYDHNDYDLNVDHNHNIDPDYDIDPGFSNPLNNPFGSQ